jgi:Na+-transporting methylmalonyl-CoA/oxaloacetate decarboxylase gamma subunit
VIKYLFGMVGALGGMLAGAWLMLAPFALAYQLSGAAWADPTYTDFWSGLAILVVSLIGLLMYVLGLVGELRRRGIIEPREEPEAQQAQAADMPAVGGAQAGSAADVEQILLPLVNAMLEDMQDQRRRREGNGGPQGAAPNQQLDPERRVQQ